MNQNNDVIRQILSEGNPFAVEVIDYINRSSKPFRVDGGAICVCTGGWAEVQIDTRSYKVDKGCEIILLEEILLFIKSSSKDFRMVTLLYSKDVVFQATHKFDPSFFNHVFSHPVYRHKGGGEDTLLSYMNILTDIQKDTRNRYGVLIGINLIRSILLNAYDKIQRFSSGEDKTPGSRREEIFNRFMGLVLKHGRKHRDVKYYADKLCISSRYLCSITKEMTGESPKQSIDNYLISEIKLILTFSDMSIQQIADYLHFPDQSYFGRYFKHFTGMSPASYRQNEMVL